MSYAFCMTGMHLEIDKTILALPTTSWFIFKVLVPRSPPVGERSGILKLTPHYKSAGASSQSRSKGGIFCGAKAIL
jgi:hypothetical protein